MTHGYENGHGSGIRVNTPRNYVRKAEYRAKKAGEQPLPPPGGGWEEEQRMKREAKIIEAMTIGFQRRRLPDEDTFPRADLFILAGRA